MTSEEWIRRMRVRDMVLELRKWENALNETLPDIGYIDARTDLRIYFRMSRDNAKKWLEENCTNEELLEHLI